ncbi:putative copper resistance protein D [Sphingomonas jejuensis]|uniref:Copper resistance protein D n=1 Tax=Sphingomonas jejuensis TaxID=904715 RepID=A0ABX0XH04_9SPHN|nr:putative copper resistance protein D [Sphingomonas jejuensis]
MTEAGPIAARFLHYAALVLVFGAFAYASYGAGSASVTRRLGRLGLASSAMLLLAAAAVLIATVAGLGGGFASLSDATLWSAVVTETDFGRVWSVRLVMAALLIAVAVVTWRRPVRALRRTGLLLAGGLVVTVALTGHATAQEGVAGLFHRTADAAHLLAAAVWLGALPPLLFLLAQDASGVRGDLETASARLVAFHSIGLAAVAVLVVSGAVNSWFLVESLDRLFTTTYGGILLAKLAVFATMIGLAASNRLRLVPALASSLTSGCDSERVRSRLRLHIRAELALGLLVLLAVAILGTIVPAAE